MTRPRLWDAVYFTKDATKRSLALYGNQTRDFTYVDDAVRALRDAALTDWCGVANIGGGARTSMSEVITMIEDLGGPVKIAQGGTQKGDVRHTGADTRVAASAFGYAPRTQLRSGLEAMLRWAHEQPEAAK